MLWCLWIAEPPQKTLVIDKTVALKIGKHHEFVAIGIKHLKCVHERGIIVLAKELPRHDVSKFIFVDLAVPIFVNIINEPLNVLNIAQSVYLSESLSQFFGGDEVVFILERLEGNLYNFLLLSCELGGETCSED